MFLAGSKITYFWDFVNFNTCGSEILTNLLRYDKVFCSVGVQTIDFFVVADFTGVRYNQALERHVEMKNLFGSILLVLSLLIPSIPQAGEPPSEETLLEDTVVRHEARPKVTSRKSTFFKTPLGRVKMSHVTFSDGDKWVSIDLNEERLISDGAAYLLTTLTVGERVFIPGWQGINEIVGTDLIEVLKFYQFPPALPFLTNDGINACTSMVCTVTDGEHIAFKGVIYFDIKLDKWVSVKYNSTPRRPVQTIEQMNVPNQNWYLLVHARAKGEPLRQTVFDVDKGMLIPQQPGQP